MAWLNVPSRLLLNSFFSLSLQFCLFSFAWFEKWVMKEKRNLESVDDDYWVLMLIVDDLYEVLMCHNRI